jgi:coenzyme F420-reducing hydrogenase delta subunit
MVNVSAASAQKFAEYVREMVETVRKLGPARLKRLTKQS